MMNGMLARYFCKADIPLQVCKSHAGFYIGTKDENGMPFTRESLQYWETHAVAQDALDTGMWTQKREL